jgi:hypothetical protein
MVSCILRRGTLALDFDAGRGWALGAERLHFAPRRYERILRRASLGRQQEERHVAEESAQFQHPAEFERALHDIADLIRVLGQKVEVALVRPPHRPHDEDHRQWLGHVDRNRVRKVREHLELKEHIPSKSVHVSVADGDEHGLVFSFSQYLAPEGEASRESALDAHI